MCWFSFQRLFSELCWEKTGESALPPFIRNNHLSKHPQTNLTVCAQIWGIKEASHPPLSGNMCSNNSGKKTNGPVFCGRTSPTASFIRVPRQHRWHESGANRGPFEKIAFQGLKCVWLLSHGGTACCAHIHSLGPGVCTDNINKRPKSRIMVD